MVLNIIIKIIIAIAAFLTTATGIFLIFVYRPDSGLLLLMLGLINTVLLIMCIVRDASKRRRSN